jgi:hypothetical protein
VINLKVFPIFINIWKNPKSLSKNRYTKFNIAIFMKYTGRDILGKYEDDTTEFKKEISKTNNVRIRKTICAISNGYKIGSLYLGIEEEKNENPILPGKAMKIVKIKNKDLIIIEQTIQAIASLITPSPNLELFNDGEGFVRVDIKPSFEISEITREKKPYEVWIRTGHTNKQLLGYKEKEKVAQQKSIYKGYEILGMLTNSISQGSMVTTEMIELFIPEIEDSLKKLWFIYGNQIIGIFQAWGNLRNELGPFKGSSISFGSSLAGHINKIYEYMKSFIDK